MAPAEEEAPRGGPIRCRNNHPRFLPSGRRLVTQTTFSCVVFFFSYYMGLKPQVGCPFCEYISPCPLPTDGSNARDHDSAPSAPSAGCGRLAVVPVEEEQGEGAHHQEEEHPHAEASVVLDGLGGRGTGG